MSQFWEGVVSIIAVFAGVAIVSVLVSKNAQTPAVAQSFFSGVGNDLGVAISPVTGANVGINLSYPSSTDLSMMQGA